MSFELSVRGPISPADVPGLCARVQELLAGGGGGCPNDGVVDLVCDVRELGVPDLATVDALARVQLIAARLGHRLVLQDASPEVRQLLDLAGLADALPAAVDREMSESASPDYLLDQLRWP